jgi:hypothetical protein
MYDEGDGWVVKVTRSALIEWAKCWEDLLDGAPVSVGYARRNQRYIQDMRDLADSMNND